MKLPQDLTLDQIVDELSALVYVWKNIAKRVDIIVNKEAKAVQRQKLQQVQAEVKALSNEYCKRIDNLLYNNWEWKQENKN